MSQNCVFWWFNSVLGNDWGRIRARILVSWLLDGRCSWFWFEFGACQLSGCGDILFRGETIVCCWTYNQRRKSWSVNILTYYNQIE